MSSLLFMTGGKENLERYQFIVSRFPHFSETTQIRLARKNKKSRKAKKKKKTPLDRLSDSSSNRSSDRSSDRLRYR